ncbi:glycerophosphodiester phosphodiesterase family protein [Erythrobacter sp. MTPC3]|uniref:glycerophosphodiester phosphodiesterase family protein n=1 Tax=Erythrobacter sp. MTPC3 TaxID=3056564 RepID=UPI0036F19A35
MKKFALWAGMAFAVLFLVLTILNASWLAPNPAGAPKQIAHRALAPELKPGVHETCPLATIEEPYNRYLPNTRDSVLRADRMGGWLIEIDAQVSADGVAVLHSQNALGCLTDGEGLVSETVLEDLQTLDAGHNYTVAGTQEAPFRGQGITIPSLESVLKALPVRGRVMVHLASPDPRLPEAVAAAFEASKRDPQAKGDAFYGSAQAVARIRVIYPEVWAFDPDAARQCTATYIAQGWSGFLPESCKGRTMLIALDQQTVLWGWPNRLIARMEAHGGEIVIEGPREPVAGEVSGITLPEQLTEIPSTFNGYVWTDDAFNTLPALIPRFDNRSQAEIDAAQAALERRRASN